MQSFKAENFFDISQYAHIKLFENLEFVWQALDRIQSYLKSYQLGKIEAKVDPRAYLINPELISIGEGTVVEPGAYIRGPCIIGKNCTIRHGAYIRGDLIAGDDCVIGHTTEVKGVIFLNHAKAGHFAYLGDTIVGNHVNLGAGTKCANLRFDNQPIVLRTEKGEIDTNRRKFGAIIGDHGEIGCNAVLNPGTILGKHVEAYPLTNFGGIVEENSRVMLPVKAIIQKKK